MSDEANMFTDCGEAGFHVNQYGIRENLILVDSKCTDTEYNKIIYSKEPIPLGNKVYLIDETYIGTASKCFMVEKSVGNIHEITVEVMVSAGFTMTEVDLSKSSYLPVTGRYEADVEL